MGKLLTKKFLQDELNKINRSDKLTLEQHQQKICILIALSHYADLEEVCGMIKLSAPETRWGTSPAYMKLVRQLFPIIDLDPASEAIFNKIVEASRYFTKNQDGLAQDWYANNVFCNPPYGSKLYSFIEKAIQELVDGHCQNVILLGSRRGSKKYRKLKNVWLGMGGLVLQHHQRIRFVDPQGKQQKAPRHDADTWYFGDSPNRFREVFGLLGDILDHRYLEMINSLEDRNPDPFP
jgi:ParB family chromosome partitioning protein